MGIHEAFFLGSLIRFGAVDGSNNVDHPPRCERRNSCSRRDHGVRDAEAARALARYAALTPSGTERRCSRPRVVADTEKYDAGSAAESGSLQNR